MSNSMSRRHFQAIADSVAGQVELVQALRTPENSDASDVALEHLDNVARDLATRLRVFNSSFDRDRFIAACAGKGK